MKIKHSSLLEADLTNIADTIRLDKPLRAITFIRELRAKIAFVEKNPHLYRLRPEIAPDARIAIHRKYLIMFRITPENALELLRVSHGARDLSALYEESQ
jgi:toxin ParE1/3/4